MVALTFVAFAGLLVATVVLGAALGSVPAGVISAALLASRDTFGREATSATLRVDRRIEPPEAVARPPARTKAARP